MTITNGSVDQVVIQDRGYNYRTAPTATIQPPLSAITATGVIKTENGEVKEITLTNAGRGYNSIPDVFLVNQDQRILHK